MRLSPLAAAAAVLLMHGLPHAAPQATPALTPAAFDPAIRPQDDLFGHVNGRWLAEARVPAEKVLTGTLGDLGDRVDLDLRAIIEEIAATGGRRRGTVAQQVGDLYASLMDEARIEALGLSPIQEQLDRIYEARDGTAFAAEAGRISALGGGGPFDGAVDADSETGELVVHLTQSGILLPDRDYYLGEDPRYAEFRKQYVLYLARIFAAANRGDAAREAERVLALETELARAQVPQAESHNARGGGERVPFADLGRAFPGFDWRAWARPQGIDRLRLVVVGQPGFFKRFAELAGSVPLETWKAWLAARYLTWASPFISAELADARFDFFGRVLSGQEVPRERWRRAVSLVSGYLGDAVGRLYVDRHFPPAARDRAERLVRSLVETFEEAIEESDWMAAETKRRARRKLARLSIRIGHPTAWRDYGRLEIRREDLFGNIQRARQFESDERLARARGQIGREYWLVTPQTVNAYYAPATNELVVTAAILQPPVFDPAADDAVNYGAIGAIVGHEIGHAFDDRGRFFDADGRIRDWWSRDDAERFAARARALAAQYDAYVAEPGLNVNGRSTLHENAGDLAGLAVAYRAYKRTLAGKPAPIVDGLTGEQRFFLSWALLWRGKLRDEYVRQWVFSSPHALPRFRVNGAASNVDGFYEAFGVRPGDRLYRAPEARVRIW